MANETVTTTMLELPSGRFVGRQAFAQAIRDACAAAAAQGWRELILCDPDFAAWPLDERQVVESLHAWSRAGRSCTIIAAGFDAVVRRHARFVDWRRTWGHIIEARVCRQIDPADFPTVLWSGHWTMQLLDPVRVAGVQSAEPERILHTREMLKELMRTGNPGFPITTLGL